MGLHLGPETAQIDWLWMIFPSWFDHLALRFYFKEVQIKYFFLQ